MGSGVPGSGVVGSGVIGSADGETAGEGGGGVLAVAPNDALRSSTGRAELREMRTVCSTSSLGACTTGACCGSVPAAVGALSVMALAGSVLLVPSVLLAGSALLVSKTCVGSVEVSRGAAPLSSEPSQAPEGEVLSWGAT